MTARCSRPRPRPPTLRARTTGRGSPPPTHPQCPLPAKDQAKSWGSMHADKKRWVVPPASISLRSQLARPADSAFRRTERSIRSSTSSQDRDQKTRPAARRTRNGIPDQDLAGVRPARSKPEISTLRRSRTNSTRRSFGTTIALFELHASAGPSSSSSGSSWYSRASSGPFGLRSEPNLIALIRFFPFRSSIALHQTCVRPRVVAALRPSHVREASYREL